MLLNYRIWGRVVGLPIDGLGVERSRAGAGRRGGARQQGLVLAATRPDGGSRGRSDDDNEDNNDNDDNDENDDNDKKDDNNDAALGGASARAG